jgi:hypothetical protein
MKNQLLNTLEKKWKEKNLGHFYILEGDKEDLGSFIDEFLKRILSGDLTPANHPDILYISKESEKKTYSFESDFSELFIFNKYSPLFLDKKIIILPDAQLLTVDISNKILRTLEDLKEGVFFFLCPPQITLLPTIESRAIRLRIPKSKIEGLNNLYSSSQFQEWLTSNNLPPNLFKNFSGIIPFLEDLKEDVESQTHILNLLLNWESNHLSDYKHKESFLEEIKRFQTSLIYNNLFKERFVSLLSSCQVS